MFAVYFHKLKLRNIEIMQNVLTPAVEMLKLPAQNIAYEDECHVSSNVYITSFEETKRCVSTGL